MFFMRYFIYFLIYAFLGYICEVIYVFICTKKITNRGYLFGPLVPIYGVGALIIIFSLEWAYNLDSWYSPILVFVLGFLLTSALEYLTSFVMEMIFHMRWWDYSDKLLNIKGRVCLRNSTMFGILVMIVMYGLNPYVVVYLTDILFDYSLVLSIILISVLGVLFIVDIIISTIKHVNISKLIRSLDKYLEAIKEEAKNTIKEKKDSITKGYNSIKEGLKDNRIINKLSKVTIHYPSLKLPKNINKKLSDLIEEAKNIVRKG